MLANQLIRLVMTLLALTVSVAHAQSTAEVTGTITDSSGAVVPSAAIVVTHEGTGIRAETTSSAEGIYNIRFLRPGAYRIDVRKEGFRAVARAGVGLQVAHSVRVDFELPVGAVAEVLNVNETAPLLETTSNVLGGAVTAEKVENLPIKGRNSSAFMFLTPGVRVPRVALNQPVLESHWQFFSINGSRPNQNQFLLDGGNNNDTGFNGPQYSAPVETVQEMRVQTSNFSAEYGNAAGGVINTVTKSGTNEFHGSAFEYFRNDVLQAGNFFSNLNGQRKPTLRSNQFGGTIGGPIKRNKTFFFGSYEGLRLRLPAGTAGTAAGLVNIISVPTDLQKAGNFSQTLTSTGALVGIYDPTTTRADPANPGRSIRTAFAGNVIPAARINAISAAVTKYYPAGNSVGDPFTGLNNLFFSGAQSQTSDDVSIRIDHQINDSTSLMGRFSDAFVNIAAPSIFPNIADPYNSNTDQKHMSSVMKLNKTFSPNIVGEFVFSWNRFYHYRTQVSTANFNPTDLGFPAYVATNSPVLGFPQFNIEGMSRVGGYIYEPHAYDRPNASASFIMMRGKHSFKYGAAFHVPRLNGISRHHNAGSYNVTKAFTQGPDPLLSGPQSGLGFATFLLGNPITGSHFPNIIDTAATAKNLGLYFQDDYKVSPQLTLNIGVRWDYEAPRTERYNRLTNWNFEGSATLPNGARVRGGEMFPGLDGLSRGQWESQLTNFQPRIGFAYNVAKNTVIRSGFGIFFGNSWGGAANYNQLANFGHACSTPIAGSLDGGLTPATTFSDPFPTGFCTQSSTSLGLLANLGENIGVVNRNHQVPKSLSWSFDIQQRLPKDVLFEITYSANRGLNLIGFRELNQLAPQHLALGGQLNSLVPNPFVGAIRVGPLAAPTITLGQSLRPYPQFQTVTSAVETYGASTYHALYLKVERRFANGFSILGSYTFSKIIDDVIGGQTGFAGDGFSRGDLQNFYDNRVERAIGSYNTPQNLVISYVYELPFGPGKKFLTQGGVTGKLAGGWQINGTMLFQSGPPLQILGGNNNGTMAGLMRPNWNGQNPTIEGQDLSNEGRARYFDTSAFSFNAPFTIGTAPRLMPNLYGPGAANYDISLFKNTNITERWRLQFRAEAFNAFNRVQFGLPERSINSNAFGRISTQANLPRDFQLALRLLF